MFQPTELDVEKNKLNTVLNSIENPVVLVDTSHKISFFNKAAEKLTGYTKNQAVGQDIGTIIKFFNADEEVSGDVYCPNNEFDIEGVVYENPKINILDIDKKLNLVSVETRKIKSASLINLGCIMIIKDIDEASEFEKMKVDFVSMSVHTLRTPVTILRGYLSALKTPDALKKLNQSEIENLENALKGANELKDLVEKLLNLSDLQQSRPNANAISFDFEELVRVTVDRYQQVASTKNLTLVFNKPIYKLPYVRADFKMIQEVLGRLLDNAIKYTEQGGVSVTLGQQGEEIVTSIQDTGSGIPSKNLEHVFEKFYRVKSTALEMEYGTGISLFICKKIIESYKGRIWAESIEGKGSIFSFSLFIDGKK